MAFDIADEQAVAPVVAVLTTEGPQVVAPDTAIVRADDTGLFLGDGAFETLHVRNDSAWLIDAHLDRFATSLTRMEIPRPPREALEELLRTAITAWNSQHSEDNTAADSSISPVEAGVKLVCTRGPEFGKPHQPTVYAMVFPVPAALIAARANGVRLAALSWGISADIRSSAPWLLGGVKSLSYALNMATLREAHRRGGDDALLVSSDGYVLEGPTSSVMWHRGRTLYRVDHGTGILPSTTVAHVCKHAPKFGLSVAIKNVTLEEFREADGAWLCSSVRGVVPVTAIIGDGLAATPITEFPTSPHTDALRGIVAL